MIFEWSLNGFDYQEPRNLTFVKKDFPVLKLKLHLSTVCIPLRDLSSSNHLAVLVAYLHTYATLLCIAWLQQQQENAFMQLQ